MRLDTLEDLYLDRLRDARGAEERLLAILPDLIATVSDPELAQTMARGGDAVRAGLDALDEIAVRHDEPTASGPSEGMAALVSEARCGALEAPIGEPETRDALIAMHHRRLTQHVVADHACLTALATRLHLHADADALRACVDGIGRDAGPLTYLATGTAGP